MPTILTLEELRQEEHDQPGLQIENCLNGTKPISSNSKAKNWLTVNWEQRK